MALLGILVAQTMLASGSYAARPPQPPASIQAEAQRYEFGKAIYNRRVPLAERPPAERTRQSVLLADLQQRLPASARAQANLAEFAGRLDDSQLVALEHFLRVRFRLGKEAK
jgi:predicted dienelactone hydrolase